MGLVVCRSVGKFLVVLAAIGMAISGCSTDTDVGREPDGTCRTEQHRTFLGIEYSSRDWSALCPNTTPE